MRQQTRSTRQKGDAHVFDVSSPLRGDVDKQKDFALVVPKGDILARNVLKQIAVRVTTGVSRTDIRDL